MAHASHTHERLKDSPMPFRKREAAEHAKQEHISRRLSSLKKTRRRFWCRAS
jgi:hypothetical protein